MKNETVTLSRELAQNALNAVEYLALRGDDIGTSNVPVAEALRAALADPVPPAGCATCNGTGIEYDGAGHVCTACNGQPLRTHGREPEVVGYTTQGMVEIARRIPLTGRVGAKASKDDRWNIPLIRLEDHRAHVTRLQAELAESDHCFVSMANKVQALQSELTKALAEPVPPACCTPTAEEQALLANGDYTPEELWGGSRKACPKCFGFGSLPARLPGEGETDYRARCKVPPAGGEPEVEGYKYRIKNRPNRAWTYAKDQPQQFSEEFDIVPLYAQHVVTRLQAEVEEWKASRNDLIEGNDELHETIAELQSELTKARELLSDVHSACKGERCYAHLEFYVEAEIAHQSAPAAKAEQPAPVAVAPDMTELRDYHAKTVKDLEHYADDSGLRESDVKHYRKRAEFHRRQVAPLDSLK